MFPINEVINLEYICGESSVLVTVKVCKFVYISIALFHFISVGSSSLQYNSELWSGWRGGDGE